MAQPNIEWAKTLGGTGNDIAYDVEQTSDGGFIIAGVTYSVDGDITEVHGFKDYWVVKLANDGTLEWEKTYGGSGHDIARDILQTNDGGYIMTGISGSDDGQVTGHHGLNDYWVVKITSDGAIEWEKSLGGYGNEFSYAIYQTDDGGYIVGGASDSDTGDVTNNHGDTDYWVVKLTSDGIIEWEKSLGGPDDDFAYSLEQTSDGGYIIAGKSHLANASNFVDDIWVIKLTSSGEIEWEKFIGGTDHELAYAIRQAPDGTYVVAGYSRSIDGDVSGNHGGWDYLVTKLDTNGDILWLKSLGGFQADLAHAVQVTTDGGYIVTGSSESSGGDATDNHGSQDFWVIKLTSEGEIDWQKSIGGTSHEKAFSVQQTQDGGYVMAGYAYSNNGDVSGNHGGGDFWIVKLGACGLNTNVMAEEHSIQSLEVALSSTFQWIDCSDGAIIAGETSASFSPDTGGDYAVILSNGNCVDTSTCVIFCPLNVDVIVGENTIQSMENAPNVTFQWMNCNTEMIVEGENNQTFEPLINGGYAVILTEENCSITSECTTMCPESINIEVVAVEGTIEVLSDTSLFTFQWIKCSGTPFYLETSHLFTPEVSGDYAVIVNENGCTATSDCITVCLVDTTVFMADNVLQSAADALNSTYQWIDCSDESLLAGEIGQTFEPTKTGEYAVIITQGSCVDTSGCVTFCLIDTDISMVDNMLQSAADTLNSTFLWFDCSDESLLIEEVSQTFVPTQTGEYAVIITQGSCVDTSDCITFCSIDTNISIIEDGIQSSADVLSSTFLWFDCSDESLFIEEVGQTFTPTMTGEYGVIITQGDCFEISDCVNFMVVDVDEPTKHDIKIFPNPVQDFIIIETSTKRLGNIYDIYNTNGKKVFSGSIETVNTKVSLVGLPNGVYTIKIGSLNEVVILSFVKN